MFTADSRMHHSTFWPPSRTCAASIYAASPTQATRTSMASRTRITGAYACIYIHHVRVYTYIIRTHADVSMYACLFDGWRKMYVCRFVCTYVCNRWPARLQLSALVSTLLYITQICMPVRVHIRMHACLSVCMYVCMHACMPMYSCVHTQT